MRDKNKIAFTQHKFNFLDNTPSHAGIKNYNFLPENITKIEDIQIFKNKLKNNLLPNNFKHLMNVVYKTSVN